MGLQNKSKNNQGFHLLPLVYGDVEWLVNNGVVIFPFSQTGCL